MRILYTLVIFFLTAQTAWADGKTDMNAGSNALRLGNFAEAVTYLTRAINSEMFRGEASAAMLISRGQAYYHLQEYQHAIIDLTVAIESGDINNTLLGIALATRASCQRMLGNFTNAIHDFNGAINIGTNNDKMFFHRGLALQQSGQIIKAIKDFKTAYKMVPTNTIYEEKLTELGESID